MLFVLLYLVTQLFSLQSFIAASLKKEVVIRIEYEHLLRRRRVRMAMCFEKMFSLRSKVKNAAWRSSLIVTKYCIYVCVDPRDMNRFLNVCGWHTYLVRREKSCLSCIGDFWMCVGVTYLVSLFSASRKNLVCKETVRVPNMYTRLTLCRRNLIFDVFDVWCSLCR